MAVYNVVIACVVGTPVVTFVQDNQFEASFIVTAICILFSTTSTLCIVFVPKVRVCKSLSVCLPAWLLSVCQSVNPLVRQSANQYVSPFVCLSRRQLTDKETVSQSVNLRIKPPPSSKPNQYWLFAVSQSIGRLVSHQEWVNRYDHDQSLFNEIADQETNR